MFGEIERVMPPLVGCPQSDGNAHLLVRSSVSSSS
jgi:hypothetical protein